MIASEPARARRRGFAVVLVGALAAVSVIGLAPVASAAPASVTIVSPTPSAVVTNSVDVTFALAPAAPIGSTAGVDVVGAPAGSAGCLDDTVPGGAVDGSCTVTLPVDVYGMYLLQAWSDDGAGRTDSPVRGVAYGSDALPTINESASGVVGTAAEFSGTGPALGTFSLRATPTAGGVESQVCAGTISDIGTWNCMPSLAQLRSWNIAVSTTSIVGTAGVSAPVTFETRPDLPLLTAVVDLGAVQVTVTGSDGASSAVRLYTDFGGLISYDSGCPAAAGEFGVPTGGPVVVCDFAALPVGIHLLSSAAYINDVKSFDRGDLILVPGAPTITSATVLADGTTRIEGTRAESVTSDGTLNDGTVIRAVDDGGNTVCSDEVASAAADWSCLTETTVLSAIRAYADSIGFRDDPNIDGLPNETYVNGASGFAAGSAAAAPYVYLTSPNAGGSTEDATPTFNGIGTPNRSVTVFNVDLDPDTELIACGPVSAAPDGTWSCTPTAALSPGVTTVNVELQPPGEAWPINTGEIEFLIGALPSAPTTTYTFGPARFGVTVTGQAEATIQTELYRVEVIEGEPYQFGSPVDTCPASAPEDMRPGQGPGPVQSCTFIGLAPGVWNIYASQFAQEGAAGPYYSPWLDDYVLIPATPTLDAPTVNSNGTVTFSGTGTSAIASASAGVEIAGSLAIVRTAAGQTVCQSVVSDAGAWQCIAAAPTATMGYTALQQSQGFVANPGGPEPVFNSFDGFSSLAAARTVTIPSASPLPDTSGPQTPTPGPGPQTPTPGPAPTAPSWTLGQFTGLEDTKLTPGRNLKLSGGGVPPFSTVVAEIRSTPRILGSTVADDGGAFSLPVVIPEDMDPGNHTIVLIITPPGAMAVEFAEPVTILPAPSAFSAAAADTAVNNPADDGTGAGSSGSGAGSDAETAARSDPAAPSAITNSLPTYRDILSNPLVVAGAGGLALAALLLVAFPSELLNSTLSSNTRRFGRWFEAVERVSNNATAWFIRVTRTPAAAAAVLVLVTSILFGFVDPRFGFDPTSVRLVLALAIALFIITYVSSWIGGAIIKRVWDVRSTIELQPSALLFAVVGVVIARFLEFSPGFLVGLVIGLELASNTAVHRRVRSGLVTLGVLVGIAVIAWLGYSAMTLGQTGEATFASQLVLDTLAAVTAEGLTAAFVSLLPLGFLEGRLLFQYSKKLWVGTFLVVGTGFSLLVLPTAVGGTEVRDLATWTIVLVGFAVVTLAIWAWMHFTSTNTNGEDDEAFALDRVDADQKG